MKFMKLLVAFAVLSILVAPVLSIHDGKVCRHVEMSDESEGCDDDSSATATNCCGNCSGDSCYSGYACFSQSSTPSGIEGYDPDYSYVSKGSTRPFGRGYTSTGSWSGGGGACTDLSSAGSSDIGPPYPKAVEHLPPSAKLVYKVLEAEGLLTQKDLINKTYLPGRTVRYALARLKGENVLQERFCFQDARQTLYGLNMAVINGAQM